MVISRTPFRLSFFGGGTDYPAWYREHGGAVLATTIDKYCYLTCRYLPPFFDHRFRIVWSRIENCHSIDEISHPAVRAVLHQLRVTRGLEIHHDGDLPARSGSGSSSSFAVGLLHALHALQGRMVSSEDLAREAIHIEQNVMGETVGSQDQVSAAHGGFNHITFQPNGRIAVAPVALRRERLHELEAHTMLLFTGFQRTASGVAQHYVDAASTQAGTLQRMGEMVQEGLAILQGHGAIEEFGTLLHEGWRLKQSLGDTISNGHIQSIYAQARDLGAIGGKLSGAGGGGFLLLFAPPDCHAAIRDRFSGLVHVPIRFESGGSKILFYDQEEDFEQLDQRRQAIPFRPFQDLDAMPKAAEGSE